MRQVSNKRKAPKMKNKLPLLRAENLVVKELPNEVLIYDLENNKAYCLNETARAVMHECNGSITIDEAVTSLNTRLKTPVNEEMVWLAIDQLKKAGLFNGEFEVPIQTSRVSRRKMLQSAAALGLALPMVTSLVAPSAIHAQSNCIQIEGGQCTINPNNCCTPAVCIDIGQGFTACVGCIPLGLPCTIGGAACCGQAFCFNTESGPTGRQCVPPIG